LKIREILSDKNLTEEERNKKALAIATNMYNYGSNVVCGLTSALQGAAALQAGEHIGTAMMVTEATCAFSWVIAGVVVVAKSSIDYKKFKKGKITKEQMEKN